MRRVQVTKTKKRNMIFGTKTNEEVLVIGLLGTSALLWMMFCIIILGIFAGLILSVILAFVHLIIYGMIMRHDKYYQMPKYMVGWKRLLSKRKKKVFFYDYKVSNDGRITLPVMTKTIQEEINKEEINKEGGVVSE